MYKPKPKGEKYQILANNVPIQNVETKHKAYLLGDQILQLIKERKYINTLAEESSHW